MVNISVILKLEYNTHMQLKDIHLGMVVRVNLPDDNRIGYVRDVEETPSGLPIFAIRFSDGFERLLFPEEFDKADEDHTSR